MQFCEIESRKEGNGRVRIFERRRVRTIMLPVPIVAREGAFLRLLGLDCRLVRDARRSIRRNGSRRRRRSRSRFARFVLG